MLLTTYLAVVKVAVAVVHHPERWGGGLQRSHRDAHAGGCGCIRMSPHLCARTSVARGGSGRNQGTLLPQQRLLSVAQLCRRLPLSQSK